MKTKAAMIKKNLLSLFISVYIYKITAQPQKQNNDSL